MQESLFKPISRDERQEEARVKWIKSKCKGTFVQPTGCGKTTSALKCLKSVLDKYPHMRVLVVVPTDNLKGQWRRHLDNWGMEFNTEVQVINTVITRDWDVDILVLDEVHRYAADTFARVFGRVKYKYILGLTATFERLDGKHELLGKYCPIIDLITQQEALENGWVSEYKEYLVLIDVEDFENYLHYNKEFQEHFEFFGYDFALANKCVGPEGWKGQIALRDTMCPNGTEEQKKQVLKSIKYHSARFYACLSQRKSFINNHPKKLEIARRIIEARPNSKIITFSNNIKMAESIGMGGRVYSGRDSKKKGRVTMEEFERGDFQIIHSVAKLNEGADIPGLSVAIILGLDSSETKAVQRKGRVIRKEGNKIAEVFNIVIDNSIETKWFTNSHKTSTYTVIDEAGLNDVLEGKEPRPYVKKIKDFTFRF